MDDDVFRNITNETFTNSTEEIDDELYEVSTYQIVLLSMLYGTISVVAIVGNSLVIWIISTTRRMQNVTHYFIANLALADIAIALFTIPFQFQAALLQRWDLPYFMCAFCPFVQVLSFNVSIFTLTAISVDRYRAVIWPLKARLSKLRAKIEITSIWIIGALLALPIAYAFRVNESVEENGYNMTTTPFCENINLTPNQMAAYRIVIFLLQYFFPLCIITFAYSRMAHRLWGSRAPGEAEGTRDANLMRNKKKVIKMLAIVVSLFALCWLPLQAYYLCSSLYPEVNSFRFINILFFTFDILAMSNSCYNPFIYGIYNEKFKREFKARFPSCGDNHWPSSDSVDLEKTGQSLIRTRSESHDWGRGLSTKKSYHTIQPNPHTARKSVHYAANRNHFELKEQSFEVHPHKYQKTPNPSTSPSPYIRNGPSDKNNGDEELL